MKTQAEWCWWQIDGCLMIAFGGNRLPFCLLGLAWKFDTTLNKDITTKRSTIKVNRATADKSDCVHQRVCPRVSTFFFVSGRGGFLLLSKYVTRLHLCCLQLLPLLSKKKFCFPIFILPEGFFFHFPFVKQQHILLLSLSLLYSVSERMLSCCLAP